MFKFAKNIEVINENIEIQTVDIKCYKNLKGNKKTKNIKALEIFIKGNINSDVYCLHFIINKPISNYYNIKNYEVKNINTNNIIDNYVVINDITYVDTLMFIDVYRLNNKIIFKLQFKDCNDEFFGNAEFEIDLNKMESYNERKSI